jgi:hypothetical protein
MLRSTAHRSDDGVCSVVLDAHQGRLAYFSAMATSRSQDDDWLVLKCPTLGATCGLVERHLVSDDLPGAWLVLSLGWARGDRTATPVKLQARMLLCRHD